ncbi:hypothetical protein BJF79_21060 [Actinomadura sp. CNU-125]|nr:hypothetical protein BJF79_21060 [Actinomadura sp. CNU-125]
MFEGADGEAPGGVGAAEEAFDVAAGDVGEVGASFVGGEEAVFADGAQEEAAEGAGSGAASMTRAPGKMSAWATIWAASLG